MGSLQFNTYQLSSISLSQKFTHPLNKPQHSRVSRSLCYYSRGKIRAIGPVPESEAQTTASEEPPRVNLAFVSSVLLPDGTPDVQLRTACGGQKLRDIMLDSNIELYGPYSRPLLNCGGGGTCSTCMVEIIQGKGLLTPRTEKEKEKLQRKPKNWRLACQTTVGDIDSRGLLVVQQLPEWKAHEWKYEKIKVSDSESS